jgi:hypothetical protein
MPLMIVTIEAIMARKSETLIINLTPCSKSNHDHYPFLLNPEFPCILANRMLEVKKAESNDNKPYC